MRKRKQFIGINLIRHPLEVMRRGIDVPKSLAELYIINVQDPELSLTAEMELGGDFSYRSVFNNLGYHNMALGYGAGTVFYPGNSPRQNVVFYPPVEPQTMPKPSLFSKIINFVLAFPKRLWHSL